jgi:hypothetical protein
MSNIEGTGQKKIGNDDNIVSPPTCELFSLWASVHTFFTFRSHQRANSVFFKKDLLSRFSSFDDQPNSFETWTTTLHDIWRFQTLNFIKLSLYLKFQI